MHGIVDLEPPVYSSIDVDDSALSIDVGSYAVRRRGPWGCLSPVSAVMGLSSPSSIDEGSSAVR